MLKFILLFLYFISSINLYAKNAQIFIKTQQINTKKLIPNNELFTYRKNNFTNIDDLHINIHKDVKLIEKFLNLSGFFESTVKYKIIENKSQYKVIFKIKEGVQYKINNILYNGEINEKYISTKEYIQKPFNVKDISNIEETITADFTKNGYANIKVQKINITKNKKLKTVDLNIIIDKGKQQIFGDTNISGITNVDKNYINKLIDWKKGEIFSQNKLETFKDNLEKLALFSNIEIKTSKNDNETNIDINLTEDKKYLIELGLRFTTTDNITYNNNGIKKLKGIIAKIKWINNNFGKHCDKLSFTAEGMPFYEKRKIINAIHRHIYPDYRFKLELSKNELYLSKYTLNYFLEMQQKWFNKYVKNGIIFGANLSQKEKSQFGSSYKIFAENYKIRTFKTSSNTKEFFSFLNFEYTLDIDMRDDYISPTKGFHAIYKITPQLCLNKSSNILMIDLLHTVYIPTLKDIQVIVPWCKFSTIFTKSNYNLPADKILYSGGPKSIRGYYLNFAGDVINDIPVGGKSVIEIGVELRHKINTNWGAAIFIEGSKINQYSMPSLGKFYNAYGFGVEYYSSIGPIKIDFGFPLKRRKGIDSFMQISVGLGYKF